MAGGQTGELEGQKTDGGGANEWEGMSWDLTIAEQVGMV